MLENLLKTWAVLAPDEFSIHEQGAHGILEKSKINSSLLDDNDYIRIKVRRNVLHELSFLDKAKLQAYIQQCIEARDEWDWLIVSGSNSKKLKVSDATVFVDGKEFLSTYSTAHEALLTVYMTALAMQRPITQGPWKHADGNIYEVLGNSDWINYEGAHSFCDFALEELPSIKIAFKGGKYYSSKDYGDRVFYDGDSGKWARLKDSFLGLKDDGRLRFEKVDD
jgi:hypothetical protein